MFDHRIAYDPEGWQKLDRLQKNLLSWNVRPCHLNKAVMKQNYTETLNQHGQPMKKEAAFSNLTRNVYNSLAKTTKKRVCPNRVERFYRRGLIGWNE